MFAMCYLLNQARLEADLTTQQNKNDAGRGIAQVEQQSLWLSFSYHA